MSLFCRLSSTKRVPKIRLCRREDYFLWRELPFLSHVIVVLVGGPRLTPYLGGPKSLGGPNLVGGTSDPATYHEKDFIFQLGGDKKETRSSSTNYLIIGEAPDHRMPPPAHFACRGPELIIRRHAVPGRSCTGPATTRLTSVFLPFWEKNSTF